MVRNPIPVRGVVRAVVDRPLEETELVERARRGDRGALGRAPRCCRLPLPARPLGGGDRGRPRRPAWDGQIANLARPRAAARGAGAGAMSALELRLRALGQALELPPEPDLAPRVLERLEGRRRPFPWRRGAVLALALL